MARKSKAPKHVKPAAPKKVRPCRLCNDSGMIRVWRKEPITGKNFPFDEVCACQNWGK